MPEVHPAGGLRERRMPGPILSGNAPETASTYEMEPFPDKSYPSDPALLRIFVMESSDRRKTNPSDGSALGTLC